LRHFRDLGSTPAHGNAHPSLCTLQVGSYFDAVSDVDVLNTLHAEGLLPEDQRIKHVATVRDLAILTPDAGFLDPDTVSFLADHEVQEILDDVRTKLLPSLDDEIRNWKSNYSARESPEDYFSPFELALEEFAKTLANDATAVVRINRGIESINDAIAEMGGEERDDYDYGGYHARAQSGPSGSDQRSIFDDVDD
jgi:hypothetical protein